MAPRVLPNAVPSLSDQAKSRPFPRLQALGMPPRMLTLMQLAGQEGTFSLIALPHMASAQPDPETAASAREPKSCPSPGTSPQDPAKESARSRGLVPPRGAAANLLKPKQPLPHLSILNPRTSPPKPAPDPSPSYAASREWPPRPQASRDQQPRRLDSSCHPSTGHTGGAFCRARPEEVQEGESSRQKKKTPRKPAVASENLKNRLMPGFILSSPGIIGNAVRALFRPQSQTAHPTLRVKTTQVWGAEPQ